MFPNDDLVKDVKSWKFVKLTNESAQILGFDYASTIQDICYDIDFNTVQVPIHYDMCQNDEQEMFYQDADSDFLKPVIAIDPNNEYEVMTSLEFLSGEFTNLDDIEIFEILTDFSR